MFQAISVLILFSAVHLSTQQPPGVPQKVGQPPHGQGGHGHGHGKPLEFASEVHNADHILEHLEKVVSTKPKEEMTEEELEFHYFKLHDYDNNNKLDGVEIGKALTHFHDDPNNPDESVPEFKDDYLAEIVDAALALEDLDNDGYVEYPEFMAAQARTRQGGWAQGDEWDLPEAPSEQLPAHQEQQQQQQQQQPAQPPAHRQQQPPHHPPQEQQPPQPPSHRQRQQQQQQQHQPPQHPPQGQQQPPQPPSHRQQQPPQPPSHKQQQQPPHHTPQEHQPPQKQEQQQQPQAPSHKQQEHHPPQEPRSAGRPTHRVHGRSEAPGV